MPSCTGPAARPTESADRSSAQAPLPDITSSSAWTKCRATAPRRTRPPRRPCRKTVPHRSFLAPDLLILDDLGLHRLSAQQSIDLYELIIGRHRSSSFVITSNRAVEEWLGLFDDPILGNSALDRLANASYQIVIEGESYRQRLSPHRALLDAQEGAD